MGGIICRYTSETEYGESTVPEDATRGTMKRDTMKAKQSALERKGCILAFLVSRVGL